MKISKPRPYHKDTIVTRTKYLFHKFESYISDISQKLTSREKNEYIKNSHLLSQIIRQMDFHFENLSSVTIMRIETDVKEILNLIIEDQGSFTEDICVRLSTYIRNWKALIDDDLHCISR